VAASEEQRFNGFPTAVLTQALQAKHAWQHAQASRVDLLLDQLEDTRSSIDRMQAAAHHLKELRTLSPSKEQRDVENRRLRRALRYAHNELQDVIEDHGDPSKCHANIAEIREKLWGNDKSDALLCATYASLAAAGFNDAAAHATSGVATQRLLSEYEPLTPLELGSQPPLSSRHRLFKGDYGPDVVVLKMYPLTDELVQGMLEQEIALRGA